MLTIFNWTHVSCVAHWTSCLFCFTTDVYLSFKVNCPIDSYIYLFGAVGVRRGKHRSAPPAPGPNCDDKVPLLGAIGSHRPVKSILKYASLSTRIGGAWSTTLLLRQHTFSLSVSLSFSLSPSCFGPACEDAVGSMSLRASRATVCVRLPVGTFVSLRSRGATSSRSWN